LISPSASVKSWLASSSPSGVPALLDPFALH
jgi:hypothetical protein